MSMKFTALLLKWDVMQANLSKFEWAVRLQGLVFYKVDKFTTMSHFFFSE